MTIRLLRLDVRRFRDRGPLLHLFPDVPGDSVGVLPTPSAPSAASRIFISLVFTALAVSAWSRATIAAGVPAGASSPYHCRDS